MTLPTSWQTVRVFGTYKRFDTGEAAHGAVTFEPVLVTAPEGAGRTVVLPKPRTVTLDVAGKIDIQLPATDDPDIAPTGWAYRVTEKIGRSEARAYFIHVPLAGGDIDLATAPQVVPIDPMAAYLTSADIGVNVASQAAAVSLDARVDALEASPGGGAWGTITGTLAAQTDLQAALDTKATAAQGAKADSALQSETDPTVPAWAKAPTKPSYTAGEVGADASGTAASAVTAHVAASDPHPQYTTTSEAAAAAPVQSVSGKTGAVSLVAADIGGLGSAATQAAGAFATAAQGTKADSAIQPGNAALSDAREWSAATVTQAQAEDSANVTRYAWTPQRVWQAVAKWFTTVKDAANGVVGLDANSDTKPLSTRGTNTQAALGAEMLTNGTFAGDASGWTLGAGWAYGTNNIICTMSGSATKAQQTITGVVSSKSYYVTWTETRSAANNGVTTANIGAKNSTATTGAYGATTRAEVITASATGSLEFGITANGASGTVAISNVRVMLLTPSAPVQVFKDANGVVRSEMRISSAAGNVGSGSQCQQSLTTGSYNIGSGSQCQQSLTTGSYNIGSGSQCQQSLTTGSSNIGSGYLCQQSLTTGSYNCAFAAYAQQNLKTGNSNVSFGLWSLTNLETGSGNYSAGQNSGRYNNDGSAHTSGDNGVYVGNDARASANGTQNEFVLGSSARGEGTNTTVIGSTSQRYALINGAIASGKSIVASLPTASSVPVGAHYFATNGRKSGEGAGAGTGVPVWSDGAAWKTYYDNTTVAA